MKLRNITKKKPQRKRLTKHSQRAWDSRNKDEYVRLMNNISNIDSRLRVTQFRIYVLFSPNFVNHQRTARVK